MNNRMGLPQGFQHLEPYVQQWAVMGLEQRAVARDTSSMAEKKAFAAAMESQIASIYTAIKDIPVVQLKEEEQRLMALLLSYGHVSLTLDGREAQESEHVLCRKEMVLTSIPCVLPMERELSF